MKNIFLSLAILLIFFSGAGKKAKPLKCHKTFSSEQVQEDFRVLVATLREAHPDLYRVNSKETIDKRIAEIQAQLKTPKSYLEFLKLIAPLFTEIGCVNTQWGHAADFMAFRNEKIPLFPLQLSIRDERFFIGTNYSTDLSIEEESEILKIDGETPKEYLEKNYPILPTDGKIKSIRQRWLEAYFPQHHSNFWAQPDTFVLQLKDPQGKISEKSVPALLMKDINRNKANKTKPGQPLEFYIDSMTGVITIKNLNVTAIDHSGMNFKLFLDSCFKKFHDEKISSVILDLKGDGWGNNYYGALLYSYLVNEPFTYLQELKPAKNTNYTYKENIILFPEPQDDVYLPMTNSFSPGKFSFTGKLYVITDGWNAGAKGLFCAKVSERPGTFFAGEECGASIFGMNDLQLTLVLPNTAIQVFIPTAQLICKKENYTSVKGVKVDYPFDGTANENIVSKLIGLIRQ